jgi:hypothetical protein
MGQQSTCDNHTAKLRPSYWLILIAPAGFRADFLEDELLTTAGGPTYTNDVILGWLSAHH